jgi:soluble lytic murein transglycosylase-like protein
VRPYRAARSPKRRGRIARGRPQAVPRRAAVWRGRWIFHLWLLVVGLGTIWSSEPAVQAQSVFAIAPAQRVDTPATADDESSAPGPSTAPSRQGLLLSVVDDGLGAGGGGATAPTRPPTVYDLAAARYGLNAALLKALHDVESSAASDGCLENLEGSGAVGPFQFMPSTFRAYGVDGDGSGRADICGFVDSLFSAARYLHVLGADADPTSEVTRAALARYGTDPEWVIGLARDRLAGNGGAVIVLE